jgi:hypothetical protein
MPAVHPFLFIMWLIFFFYSANPDTLSSAREILAPLIFATSLLLLLWIPLTVLAGNGKKAALSASCGVILLSSYSLVPILFPGMTERPSLNTVMVLLWVILLVFGLYLPLRVRKHLQAVTTIFNAVALVMLATSAVQIAAIRLRARAILSGIRQGEVTPQNAGRRDIRSLPNIYYIILDGYARHDILEELYQYDNSPFLSYLTQKGFYVARRSTANYNQTALSLASSLNFEYLDVVTREAGPQYPYRMPLTGMIQDAKAIHLLMQCGYRLVALGSGCPYTEMRRADTYIRTGHLGLFANALIGIYLPRGITKRLGIQHHIHAQSIQRTFEYLGTTPELKPPIFVFAHVLAPHPPFVFEEDGEKRAPRRVFWFFEGSALIQGRDSVRRQYRREYTSQLTFINKMVMRTVDEILAKSSRPPIIIIQADHGPGSLLDSEDRRSTHHGERMSILNAYLLPGAASKWLYDEISPVNTFRIIGNHYLGTNLPLLEDRCYYSTGSHPYAFVDVTAEVHAKSPELTGRAD